MYLLLRALREETAGVVVTWSNGLHTDPFTWTKARNMNESALCDQVWSGKYDAINRGLPKVHLPNNWKAISFRGSFHNV